MTQMDLDITISQFEILEKKNQAVKFKTEEERRAYLVGYITGMNSLGAELVTIGVIEEDKE